MINSQQSNSVEEWHEQCVNGIIDQGHNSCRTPQTLEEYIDIFGCHGSDDDDDDDNSAELVGYQQANSIEEWYEQRMNGMNDQSNNSCGTPKTLEEYMDIFGCLGRDYEYENNSESSQMFNDDIESENDNTVERFVNFDKGSEQEKELNFDGVQKVDKKADASTCETEPYTPDEYFKW